MPKVEIKIYPSPQAQEQDRQKRLTEAHHSGGEFVPGRTIKLPGGRILEIRHGKPIDTDKDSFQ